MLAQRWSSSVTLRSCRSSRGRWYRRLSSDKTLARQLWPSSDGSVSKISCMAQVRAQSSTKRAEATVYTTLSREWVAQYDQEAYIEVDPRLGRALDSALLPLVWEYCSEYG